MCALETRKLESVRKPMFVTFYSYKGGVGRTLALANVATLLAKDRNEPCRVLVWDFDLAAPGLQDVVKCKWTEQRKGFVDYLDFYLRNAQVDDLSRYIHPTSIEGVDILPAGFVGGQYARRLEGIQWQDVYEEAQGFQFITNVKTQISQIRPAYDYVLIDSLTGYSDVGGICVNQLADAVVLVFRLNNQNLEGISKVYRTIKARVSDPSAPPLNVVPVISPAWPFAAAESDGWFQKARKVFDSRRLFTLSFEGSMMLGEKVLTATDRTYAIEPPILRDYRTLTRHLRSLNPQDLKTMLDQVKRSLEQEQFSDAIKALGNVIDRRPRVERYWREIATSVQTAPSLVRQRIKPIVNEIIRREGDAQNPWAYVTKGWLSETVENDWQRALDEYGKAIELEPQNPDLYFIRGLSQTGHQEAPPSRIAAAAADFQKAIELNVRTSKLEFAYLHLGDCFRRLGDPDKALQYFSEALKRNPNDDAYIRWEAVTLYSAERYSLAADALERALRLNPSWEGLKVLSAHVAASLGKFDEARRILDVLRSQVEPNSSFLLSVIEAYLVISPAESMSMIEANPDLPKEDAPITLFLRAFAAILLGQQETSEEALAQLKHSPISPAQLGWDISEIREFLRWGRDSGKITDAQLRELLRLIEAGGWAQPAASGTPVSV